MKRASLRRTAVLFLILGISLAAGTGAGAQNPPEQEELSEELATFVRSRWEAIEQESSILPDEEWVGRYRSQNGPTTSTFMAWSPASGFMIWRENCSRPSTTRVNYGTAEYTNGALKLSAQLSENIPGYYEVAPEFIPVKWGEQHFLIPSDRMINFVYAVNSTSFMEVESFLIKIEDQVKPRKGQPNLPEEYRKYLGMKPIMATLSALGPKVKRWYPKLILNVGRAEGVVQGMKFYISRPETVYMQLVVTDVQEHTSEAFVITTTFTDNRQGDVEPKVGWKFTSRAPADNWEKDPG
ncbi:MAG TPA: hypothetical protein VGX92_18615 [Pyrinomonadaceae bacterium]|jgi:hypothetical protein|nr:hypothetical protein [Pyrinomonadaceae bacterium]